MSSASFFAEHTTTGTGSPSACRSSSTDHPSIPGSITSSTTASGRSAWMREIAVRPSPARIGSTPIAVRFTRRTTRRSGSSSTIKTRGFSVGAIIPSSDALVPQFDQLGDVGALGLVQARVGDGGRSLFGEHGDGPQVVLREGEVRGRIDVQDADDLVAVDQRQR